MYFIDDYAINLAHVQLVQRNSDGTCLVLFTDEAMLTLPPEHFLEICEAMFKFYAVGQ